MTRLPCFAPTLALSVLSLSALSLSFAARTSAQRLVTADDSVAVVRPAPPLPVSVGTGSGFGGMLGTESGRDVTIAWDTDVLGRVTFTLQNAACTGPNDVIVIYLDTVRGGGFADTTMFTDTFSLEARAVSASPDGATLTFPAGFGAERAIAVRNVEGAPVAFLYELTAAGGHVARSLGTNQPAGVCGELRVGGFTLANMGMSPGDDLLWLATLLNGSNGFRSNEFHGVLGPVANIGANPFTLAADDYHVFTTIGPLVINEIDAQTPGTDRDELIELFGPPNARLDGAVLVAWNGATDTSYNLAPFTAGIDLDGQTLDAGGFWVAGNAAVVGRDVTFNDNVLQQGPDAVSIYLANGSNFPAGTALTSMNLVDAVAYDDGADTDAELLMFFPGTVREDGGALTADLASNQRCPDGAGGPRDISAFEQWMPSPGAPNVCPCGDGDADPGEACDEGRAINGTAASCCDADCSLRAVGSSCGGPVTAACDAQDTCDASGACAANVAASGVECRASAGACDVAEVCDGASTACPSDSLAASTLVCRASAGGCDVAESCDGASPDCPPDALAASGLECRASAGGCDVAESCDGASASCPADVVLGAGVECRASAGACDVAEACDGASGICPEDAFAAAAVVCRAMATACDAAESCTGASATCPADGAAADGAPCGDGAACNGDELCMSGACVAGAAPSCDDGDACTADACAEPDGCESTAIAGCCAVDADCDDGDACTTDACGADMTCTHDPLAACCAVDADCDDGDACTTDMCGADMTCTHDALAGCCAVDADCDDGDACTTDACSAETCSNEAITGCAAGDAGTSPDGGTAPVDGGCGCRAIGGDSRTPIAWLLLAAGVALARRRARG